MSTRKSLYTRKMYPLGFGGPWGRKRHESILSGPFRGIRRSQGAIPAALRDASRVGLNSAPVYHSRGCGCAGLQSACERTTIRCEVNCGFPSAGTGSARESRRIAGRQCPVPRGRNRRGRPHPATNFGKSPEISDQAALLLSWSHRGRSAGRPHYVFLKC